MADLERVVISITCGSRSKFKDFIIKNVEIKEEENQY
tara:strand:+ start:573 stop:683 length:111 start_codon:yes stop_codon:yes gene_type:complete